MKAYERRAAKKEIYYKLATWDESNQYWKAGKRQFDSYADAQASAKAPGRYRISIIGPTLRDELLPFEVK